MNGIKIDENEFEQMTGSRQNVILFKNTEKIIELFESHRGVCEKRFSKIEDRKKKDTALASGTGIIGGAIAYILSKVSGVF
jgi:hypothetical protein